MLEAGKGRTCRHAASITSVPTPDDSLHASSPGHPQRRRTRERTACDAGRPAAVARSRANGEGIAGAPLRRHLCGHAGGRSLPASHALFLEELYSDRDFADRDAQFARIAGAIERFFPQAVVQTAVQLAQLHALTESLDDSMGVQWIAQDPCGEPARRYVQAWRAVGRRNEREGAAQGVLAIGDEMARLTRTPGLRTLLRMMRAPAVAAGLASLQRFLEMGFDTFADMARGGRAPALPHHDRRGEKRR